MNVGAYAIPEFADLDGDSDHEIYIGNFIGNTLILENKSIDIYTNECNIINTSNNGGVTNISGAAINRSTFIRAVNNSPSGKDKTLTMAEDSSLSFAPSDFGFSDADGNNLKGVIIASLPSAGTLTLSGDLVSANQFITAAELSNLLFSPATDANGRPYASFNFQVQDDAGTKIGDIDTDPSANTLTIDVRAVDDPAIITGDTSGSAEDASTAITGSLLATDVDGLTDGTYFSIETGDTPNEGTATVHPASGAWSYTPKPTFKGTDRFTVTITDDLNGITTHAIELNITDRTAPVISTAVIDCKNLTIKLNENIADTVPRIKIQSQEGSQQPSGQELYH